MSIPAWEGDECDDVEVTALSEEEEDHKEGEGGELLLQQSSSSSKENSSSKRSVAVFELAVWKLGSKDRSCAFSATTRWY